MYFISRHYTFFSYAAQIKPLYRYTLSALLLFFVTAVWFFLLYMPQSYTISMQQAAVRQGREQRILLAQAKRASKTLQDEIAQIKQQCMAYKKEGNFSTQVMNLMQRLRVHGLQLKNFFIAHEEFADWYVRRQLSLDMHASLEQTHTFFAFLVQSEMLLDCHDFHVNQTDDGKCSIRCTIQLYELL